MTTDEAVAWLRSRGKPNTIKIYRRHGVADETFGVAYADIGTLVKRLGADHTLAAELWATAIHDARVVATKIADPAAMTRRRIDSWLDACRDYVLTGAVAGLAARMPTAANLAHEWIESPGEYRASAGWNVIATLATNSALSPARARPLIRRIGRDIHSAPNRARHNMNSALIGMGGGLPEVRDLALAVARKIGVVKVDHGQTGCRTPDAAAYIHRMAEHRASRRASVAVPRRAERTLVGRAVKKIGA